MIENISPAAYLSKENHHLEIAVAECPHHTVLWRAPTDAFEAASSNPDAILPAPVLTEVHTASGLAIVDRYGGTAIGRNGGSGRAVIYKGFSIKGVGRTPLIGHGPFENLSDGWCTLEEAVREAIYSEILRVCLPHGVVPVLGIIYIPGEFSTVRKNRAGIERGRCLIVRKAFLRPAHFKQATSFLPLNDATSWATDAQRVISSVNTLLQDVGVGGAHDAVFDLWAKYLEQLAFSFVWRINIGIPNLGNVAFDGRIVDFGSHTAVPSWATVAPNLRWIKLHSQVDGLCQEIKRLCISFSSHGAFPSDFYSKFHAAAMRRFWTALLVEFMVAFGVSRRRAMSLPLTSAQRATAIRAVIQLIDSHQSTSVDMLELDANSSEFANIWNAANAVGANLDWVKLIRDLAIDYPEENEILSSFNCCSVYGRLVRATIREDFGVQLAKLRADLDSEIVKKSISEFIDSRVKPFLLNKDVSICRL